ncbi:MAG: RimK/LysX family protein [Sulfurimonas sp.]|uniref:ATP-dependent zinc protease family protein n=1 Tax=Sulfurimonas sp. TaxID=2022749 RepID=UPI002602697A|nr:RimK/LysX family protein [Sulfurimonas sp.]MCW8896069.1 RimK/LysX family protein [Sulfurimonas sp.]MCW8954996.1 RimK/LysX family protein [Sulfurimonas sp.]MCW9067626.1 RimK/LysX family protein [Sulfurimonas sp.]
MKYLILLLLVFNLYAKDTLGRIDKFDLPELNIYNIRAKIDTGAKTSSLHCSNIIPVGDNLVKFIVLDGKNNQLTKGYITKPISRVANVKSSNGEIEQRYFVHTKIVIYNKTYDIELSLTFRDSMRYPLLIGRELLNQGFIVDTTQKNLSFKAKDN